MCCGGPGDLLPQAQASVSEPWVIVLCVAIGIVYVCAVGDLLPQA